MKNSVLSIIFLIFSTGIINAQDTLKLNFNDAVNMALNNNIQLQQEKNNLQSAQATNLGNKALFLPSIGAGSNFQYQTGIQFNQLTGQLYTATSRGAGLGIQADYTVFNGFGRINRIRNSQLLLESQQNNVNYASQEVIYTVAQQFLQVLLDRELLRIDNENLNTQKITLNQIDGFVQAGSKPLGDKLTQEALVKKLEVTRIQDENKLRMDIALLSQTLMLDPGKQIDIREPEWGFDKVLAQDFNLVELYDKALENRPDYKKSMDDASAAQAAVAIAKSNYYPTLGVSYNYGSGYTSNYLDSNGEIVPFKDQLQRNRSSTLGVSLSIPIFNQLSTVTQVTRQKVIQENYELIKKNLKSKIFQDVQTTYLNLVAAKNEYFATQSQYDAAVEAQKIQQESYELGASDLVQLSQANQTYVEAAASRIQSQYRLIFQRVMLEYSTGTLTLDNMN